MSLCVGEVDPIGNYPVLTTDNTTLNVLPEQFKVGDWLQVLTSPFPDQCGKSIPTILLNTYFPKQMEVKLWLEMTALFSYFSSKCSIVCSVNAASSQMLSICCMI